MQGTPEPSLKSTSDPPGTATRYSAEPPPVRSTESACDLGLPESVLPAFATAPAEQRWPNRDAWSISARQRCTECNTLRLRSGFGPQAGGAQSATHHLRAQPRARRSSRPHEDAMMPYSK